jgi:rhamnulokinase
VKEKCYLGVDLGAESGRVMAGLWDGKRIRLQEIHRFPNGPIQIAQTLRWDVLRLWCEIQQGLALAARRYGGAVRSVGVDTWGVDFVLLSKSGELLGQPFHYRDSRTHGLMRQAFRRVPRARIFAETGCQFMELNTLYQLMALRRDSPELLESADCLLLMPDFFHWCLSGVRVAEFTNATTTQFFHPTQRAWSKSLLGKLGLPVKSLPKVVQPGTVLGLISSGVTSATGLKSIPVVVPATHDTASAVAAVPTNRRAASWAYISSGTWSLMGLELPQARLEPRVPELNLTNEGGVDGTYRFLKNITGLWLLHRCRFAFEQEGQRLDYDQMLELATAAAPLHSFVNPDEPRFVNPPDMPKAIKQFCSESDQPVPRTKGALIRCALESLALKYEVVLGYLEELNHRRVEVIHIVGGGSRNALLNQFTADACGRPVLAGPVEATALGNVLMQARADAEIGSLSELREAVRRSFPVRRFEPQPKLASAWAEARDRFHSIICQVY